MRSSHYPHVVSFESVRIRMNILDQIFRVGLGLNRVIPSLKSLFYLLCKSEDERDFSADGFKRFRMRFSLYFNEFFSLQSTEALDLFYDRFYEFMDQCFPVINRLSTG